MSKEYYIGGIHAVNTFLDTHPADAKVLWVEQKEANARVEGLKKKAQGLGVSVQAVQPGRLERKVDCPHQGVVLQIKRAAPLASSLEDVIALVDGAADPVLLVLDGVTDPHNLGACLRSADAFGVQAVLVPKDRSAALNDTVRKVASGAAETVPVITVTNLARALIQLKEAGYWLIGADVNTTSELNNQTFSGPRVLVMGSEGSGLRELTKKHCDYLVKLPMKGTVDSLNVSVATGVFLYALTHQKIVKSKV